MGSRVFAENLHNVGHIFLLIDADSSALPAVCSLVNEHGLGYI
jgi:hypothetical protein